MALSDPRTPLRQAFSLIKAGRAPDAFIILQPILETDPDNVEAWWLLAHASPTAADAVLACQQVLLLRPGYAAAEQMLHEQELQNVRDLIAQRQQRAAYTAAKTLSEAQPANVEAWWLTAQAAPSRSESVAACHKVLALNPDHAGARAKLAEHQTLLGESLHVKQKNIKRTVNPRRRTGCILAFVALLFLLAGSSWVAMNLTGSTLGLPIGALFNADEQVGRLSAKPSIKAGTLVVGATHDYRFSVAANTLIFINVRFVTSSGNPGNAVRLINPRHEVSATGSSNGTSDHNTAIITGQLSDAGDYILRLVGTPGTAQGAYVLQMAVFDLSQSDTQPPSNLTAPGQ